MFIRLAKKWKQSTCQKNKKQKNITDDIELE